MDHKDIQTDNYSDYFSFKNQPIHINEDFTKIHFQSYPTFKIAFFENLFLYILIRVEVRRNRNLAGY